MQSLAKLEQLYISYTLIIDYLQIQHKSLQTH